MDDAERGSEAPDPRVAAAARLLLTRDVPLPPDRAYAMWTDPETRARFEAPPESGMRLHKADPREGGIEVTDIVDGEDVIGDMTQSFIVMDPGARIVATTVVRIGGKVVNVMLMTIDFLPGAGGGCRMHITDQSIDMSGNDPTEGHRLGWEGMLDRFGEIVGNLGDHS